MVDFSRLKTTLAYTRLGLVSLTAAIAPITSTAQELCGVDLFEGEPDADNLMNQTVEFLDTRSGSMARFTDQEPDHEPEADTGPGASQAGTPPAAQEPFESVFGIGSDAARTLKQRMGAKRAHYLRSRRGTPAGAADWQKDQSVGFGTAPASAKLHLSEGLTGSGSVWRAWSYQGSRPVVYEGRIYAVVGDELTATSLTSGRTLWSWSGRFDGGDERALTPPAVTSGRVYAGSADGKVLRLRPQ